MIVAAADQLRTELYYDGISITHDNSKRIAELVLRRALNAVDGHVISIAATKAEYERRQT